MSGIEGYKPRVYDHNEALVFQARIGVFKATIGRLSLKTADLAKKGVAMVWRKNVQFPVEIGGNRWE